METNLLDRMLNSYLTERKPVTVTLQNKIRVSGKIKAFDSYVIVIEDQRQEILYRHAVSSLSPFIREEPKQLPVQKPSPAQAPVSRPPKPSAQKTRTRPATRIAAAAPPGEASINNSMKEELLKWMQEQKAK